MLMTTLMPDSDITEQMESMGLDPTIGMGMHMKMVLEVMKNGNVPAYRALAEYSGQTDKSDLDIKEQELDIDRKQAGASADHKSIDDSIKEMEEYFEQQKKTDS